MQCDVGNLDLNEFDKLDVKFFDFLYKKDVEPKEVPSSEIDEAKEWLELSKTSVKLTNPMIQLFKKLQNIKEKYGATPEDLGFDRDELKLMAIKHKSVDEHKVSIGGRVMISSKIVDNANARVEEYLKVRKEVAPTGYELWDRMLENKAKIMKKLNMSEDEWNSYGGQIKHAITSPEQLASILDIPQKLIEDIQRVSHVFRMRISPYYASLIMPDVVNDPILLQSVPTGDMVDNKGIELEPVASDHSPARLIDQFYPRVLTIKATNMCAMFCTHCLRIAHISDKDWVSSNNTYEEALDYIRKDTNIRDVLITGGDALALSNKKIKYLLDELDKIDHIEIKRLGSRIPIMTPQRINQEFLDICEASNEKKPLRFVTQINSVQELTPVSKEAFRKLNKVTSAILNQAVFLRGINDNKYKMWRLCEELQNSYIRPYYLFNCSFRNPEFAHMRVPVDIGRDIVESMYGNISGDAIPRYLATAGGKIPLHRDNVVGKEQNDLILKKPWSGEEVKYPDASMEEYSKPFSFEKYKD
jgi:lysine 2,3-aminomutase